MPLDEQVTIATPEGIEVDLVLAGLGSRLIARLIDTVIQLGIILAFLAVFAEFHSGWVLAVLFILYFAVVFVYDVLFEVLGSGRTPGKRVAGLRVVRSGGQPVGFLASSIRNVLRLIDFLPTAYLLGSILIIASSKNQRLGDLAADTLVLRERREREQHDGWAAWSRPTVPADAVAGWDVSAITPNEVAAIRTFLDRRITLPADARTRFAWELAMRLGPRVPGIPADAHPEYVLEGIVVAKERRQ